MMAAFLLYYTQYKLVHECFTLLNRITTVQVSDTTMLNSSTTVDIQKEHCTFSCHVKHMLTTNNSLKSYSQSLTHNFLICILSSPSVK